MVHNSTNTMFACSLSVVAYTSFRPKT